MFDALKVKPYELEPVYVSWPDAPVFHGTQREDPVAWLEAIKAGCVARKVPKEHWYQVARHYLGPTPRRRLDELGMVMQKMTGDKHVWNWKKFKIAVQNLGLGQQSPSPSPKAHKENPPITERPMPKKQGSWWVIGKAESQEQEKDSVSSTEVVVAKSHSQSASATTPPLNAENGAVTTISSAPAWLVNACQALDFITVEHPKVMSAMSAILITIGAIPSLPAISAGAGGALLASHAVQAVGAVAVGLGQALKAMQDGKVQVEPGTANTSK